MAEPLPLPLFNALIDRAGLPLTAEERAGIHAASAHIAAAMAAVRTKHEVSVEPATTFAPQESGR